MKNGNADRKLSRTGGVVSLIALENGQAASISPVNKKAKKNGNCNNRLAPFCPSKLNQGNRTAQRRHYNRNDNADAKKD